MNVNNSDYRPIPAINRFIDINGERYLEILENHIPNIKPGQYISLKGVIYDSTNGNFRNPYYSDRYVKTHVVLKDGSRYGTGVHRLIMLVYNFTLGCERLTVNHIDGNKHNNSIDNLEWCTQQENNIHAIKNGLRPIGEDCVGSKLTRKEVEEICEELEKGLVIGIFKKLAKKYHVYDSTIISIARGENWVEVSKNYNIDYSARIEQLLTPDQVREICEELSKGRYHGQCVELGNKYGVCPSTIKEIVQRRSWTDISKDYEFPSSINKKLTEEEIHTICQIMQEFGKLDNEVFEVISERLNLEINDRTRHNIRRLFRRDPGCYYNITSQYTW